MLRIFCCAVASFIRCTAFDFLRREQNIRSMFVNCCVFETDQHDYCHTETFTADCPAEDEVLVVRSAVYGRMRGNSRCVQADPNSYIGCRADVRKYADRMCSGRRTCRIQVPNQSFEAAKACPIAYRSYLEIAVECQKGTLMLR